MVYIAEGSSSQVYPGMKPVPSYLTIVSSATHSAEQLMVSKVIMLHENTELFPSGDYYDISLGNNYPTERITLVLVGIPIRNQLVWVEAAKED